MRDSRTAHLVPYSCDMRQLSECESKFGISLVDKLIYFITLKKNIKSYMVIIVNEIINVNLLYMNH